MKNQVRIHGEQYTRIFRVNDGKTTYLKCVRFCAVHGEIDNLLCPDFVEKHGDCVPVVEPSAVGLEVPKTFAKAA